MRDQSACRRQISCQALAEQHLLVKYVLILWLYPRDRLSTYSACGTVTCTDPDWCSLGQSDYHRRDPLLNVRQQADWGGSKVNLRGSKLKTAATRSISREMIRSSLKFELFVQVQLDTFDLLESLHAPISPSM